MKKDEKMKEISAPFKPRARLLLELGNQLIKDEGIAVFELVKNAYDADASLVNVILKKIDSKENGEIIVEDFGSGMSFDTIKNVWLEPGTDFREQQILNGEKTPKYHRTPMGQKGIGRFGAHKLGQKIKLISKAKNSNEVIVEIDWGKFETKEYLENIIVKIKERIPEHFTGDKTGTSIKITGLWQTWTRATVRKIFRAVNSICSPFDTPDSFKANFELSDLDKIDWLEGLMSWKEANSSKLYEVLCTIENNELSYTYEFEPWNNMTLVTGRKVEIPNKRHGKILMTDEQKNSIDIGKYKIGKLKINLNIFDLDSNLLALGIKDKKGLREFLRYNGGLRVYRDGVRVYDYGEPGNDWLELGGRRVNIPTDRLSNNLIIGSVLIIRDDSVDLIEKTNREGFIENDAVIEFRKAILCALTNIEAERNKDKVRLRVAYSKTSFKEPVIDAVAELRVIVKKKGLDGELGGFLDRIEADYRDVRDKLLTSASAGLSLSIVIHEIEKIIKELANTLLIQKSSDKIKDLTKRLAELVEGYAALLRKDGSITVKASDIIKQAIFNVDYRLTVHKIKLIDASNKNNDFKVKCSKRMILGAVMNLIDNSIWWLANKNPKIKQIYITPSMELNEGPAIVVADNGPGFIDNIEDVIQPFFSRKPDGMGLGLHISDEIMKAHKGSFSILARGDIKLPKDIDGAISALVFNGDKDDK
jgi:anti-sigma regulatory factor (Ser/Thr protein kinase)